MKTVVLAGRDRALKAEAEASIRGNDARGAVVLTEPEHEA
jgi:hypothetical protein